MIFFAGIKIWLSKCIILSSLQSELIVLTIWPYFIQFIVFLLLFYMAIEIYLRNPTNKLHRITMCLFFAFSSIFLGHFLMNISQIEAASYLARYIILNSGFFIMSAGLYFFSALNRWSFRWFAPHLISLPPLLGVVAVCWRSPENYVTVEQRQIWRFINYSDTLQVILVCIVLYAIAGMLTLQFMAYRKAVRNGLSQQEKIRLLIIWKGAGISLVWTMILNVIGTAVGAGEDFLIVPMSVLSPLCIVIFAFFIRYAMINYDFLSSAAKRYEILFRLSPNGVVLVDEWGRIVEANRAYLKIIGLDEVESDLWHRQRVTSLIRFEESGGEEARLRQAYADRKSVLLELRIRNYKNELRVIEMNMDFIEMDGKSWTYMMVTDVTLQKEHENMLSKLAYYDALTGLLNRRRFYELLEGLFVKEDSDTLRIAVLLIDLDRFKWVNDTLGHSAGDKLLETVAQRLTAASPPEAFISRLGGDEFVILLPRVDEELEVQALASSLVQQFNQPVLLGGLHYEVTASIGICCTWIDGSNPEAIMRYADAAMYVAKKNGRNRFFVHDGRN